MQMQEPERLREGEQKKETQNEGKYKYLSCVFILKLNEVSGQCWALIGLEIFI